jgi:MFS family permease
MRICNKITQDTRLALRSVFLVVNAFIWYFLALLILQDIASKANSIEVQLIWAVHFGTLALCLIIGAMLVNRIGRRRLFVLWTLIGVISPLFLLSLNSAQTPIVLLVSFLFAASAGLGMPNCMEYFKRCTITGSRGRYAGLILLFSGLGLFALRMLGQGIVISALILIIWRLFALLALFVIKPFTETREEAANDKMATVSYSGILRQRSFLLYLIPWLMFSLVNYLSAPVPIKLLGESTYTFLEILENAIAGISAVGAGFLIDRFGRKQASIAGFAMLGLTYAVLGFNPNSVASWYMYTIFDGITWGILSILFVVSIWGEINPHASADKYYAIGILPFFISRYIGLTIADSISVSVLPSTLFSFTAFFLFLAVLPLLYAPETLPEKLMKDRDLKSYIEKAQKAVEKEISKKHKASKEGTKKQSAEPDEDTSKDYLEAKELAEKYY